MFKIKNYLNPDTYNINITSNEIYINNYTNLNNIDSNNIDIEINKHIIKITGDNLVINKILDNEVLFNGSVKKVEITYK